MKNKIILIACSIILVLNVSAQNVPAKSAVEYIESMPNLPEPYKMKNWKQTALDQDRLLYDHNAQGRFLPLIWWDDAQVNFPIRSFGLPSYVGLFHQMDKTTNYEALPTIGSLISASLLGIDKSDVSGIDYVTMVRNFYQKSNGVNLVLDLTQTNGGGSFWYDIWPTLSFNMLVDLYPQKHEMSDVMKNCADTWYNHIAVLKGKGEYPNFDYAAFDHVKNEPVDNDKWREPDAAAGVAWIEYTAYKKFRDRKYLKGAKLALDFLESKEADEGVYYEVLMPYGAYTAVRMNAEEGTDYDEVKMINWCFDSNKTPEKSCRIGWGVISENWEGYDVYGLVGQRSWEKFAFAMNTFTQAAALVPIVKYNPSYSYSIGKWMLNLANASRLFYADEHPKNRQVSASWTGDPKHSICYEGLRKDLEGENYEPLKGVLAEKGPYGMVDQVPVSMTGFAPYGSSWVGMLAAIVDTTNVPGILQLDCNATDFFCNKKYPTYLLYNPHDTKKTVTVRLPEASSKLYDLVSKKIIVKDVKGSTEIQLESKSVITIVCIPSHVKLNIKNGRMVSDDGTIIDFEIK